ncbi:MAG: COG4315 family predicted lipoprotein [Actinomycetes bacterium]
MLLTAACGGSSSVYGSSSTSSSVASSSAAATSSATTSSGAGSTGGAVVHAATTPLGPVLETANGRVVYLLTADKSGSSSCSASCLQYWPPVVVDSGTPKGVGVTGALAVLKRSDGIMQLTVAGHPAYTYAADQSAGQTGGQGMKSFGGTWWVVSPAGAAVKGAAAASSSATSGGVHGY